MCKDKHCYNTSLLWLEQLLMCLWRITYKLADSNINTCPAVFVSRFHIECRPKTEPHCCVTTHRLRSRGQWRYVTFPLTFKTEQLFPLVPRHICVHPLKNGGERLHLHHLSQRWCDGWVFLLSVSYSLDLSLSLHQISDTLFHRPCSSHPEPFLISTLLCFSFGFSPATNPEEPGEVLAVTKRGCFTLKMLLSWGNIML